MYHPVGQLQAMRPYGGNLQPQEGMWALWFD